MDVTDEVDNYIKVRSKKLTTMQTPLDEKKHRFRILLSRVAPKPTLQNQGVDEGAIFYAILCLNKYAIFLPHDNDTHCAVKLSTMIKPSFDFKAMVDLKITNWGHPSSNKGKLSMSFYLAFDTLKPDVATLRQDPSIQHIPKHHKMAMYPHNLLQSNSRPVAYFSRKSIAHTWRNNL